MPWDSQAQRESAVLGNEAADTRASLAASSQRAQNELGFGAGADNPYSRNAENRTNLANNQRGITNTAGNQLYAGSTINKQSAARSEYDKTQKQLEDSYAEEQAAYNRGQAKTTRDEQLGMTAIKEGALNRAAASEPAPIAPGRGRGRVRRPQRRTPMVGIGAFGIQARAVNARVNRRRRRR